MNRLFPFASMLVLSAAALAQEHGHEAAEKVGAIPTVEQGLITGVTALIVFALVFAVLGVKVWPAIAKGLDERASKIRSEIAAAEAARKQAKDALEQYEKSLAQARSEAQKMLEQARAQQQALADELKAKAEGELTAMKERARRDIEAAKRAALAEIYTKAADAATLMAVKILKREVRTEDRQRLMQETVAELQTMGS
jgi:F-type H+-transporting ATPase subunit b